MSSCVLLKAQTILHFQGWRRQPRPKPRLKVFGAGLSKVIILCHAMDAIMHGHTHTHFYVWSIFIKRS